MANIARYLWNEYQAAWTQEDVRTADWPMMSAYWPTLLLTVAYLVTAWVGPKIMMKYEPFSFSRLLFMYNMFLVGLNSYIFYEFFVASWRLNYSYTCQGMSYSSDPDALRIAKAIWWYYISKLVEFLDTIIFVLRKKNSQISFLNVYHHANMFVFYWIATKWYASGQAFFGPMLNSLVHVMLYTYYGIAALGIQFKEHLWWKKNLTRIQLLQFSMFFIHIMQSLFFRCDYPVLPQYMFLWHLLVFIILFINFYVQAYIRPRKSVASSGSSLMKNQVQHAVEATSVNTEPESKDKAD